VRGDLSGRIERRQETIEREGDGVKCLTISQPYASLIASGEKWVENRTWPTSYRGLIAIHAGKGTQYLDKDELKEYPTGCVVAVANLSACMPLKDMQGISRNQSVPQAGKTIGQIIDHPHAEGPVCWILSEVQKLDEPVSCRGAQGLFDLPSDVETMVREKITGQILLGEKA